MLSSHRASVPACDHLGGLSLNSLQFPDVCRVLANPSLGTVLCLWSQGAVELHPWVSWLCSCGCITQLSLLQGCA